MKKLVTLLLSIVWLCSFSITVFAADASATLSGVPSELKKDSTSTITVSLTGTPNVSSALVQLTLGDGLELVSGEWKKDGIIKDFSVSNRHGVIALSSPGTMDGTVFSFVVKGKTVSSTAQSIKVDFTFKNGSSNVGTASISKSIKVVCASHTYGGYANVNATNHTRTCTACGAIETNLHTWDSGKVTQSPTCKDTGTKVYTCTACNATKSETISKTENHAFGNWSQTQAPTCTNKGLKSRKCSICQKVETVDVAATGHSLGSWKTTKEATCESKGEQTRSCSKCSHKETKIVDALGHSFSNPEITKKPTCTEPGIESGKCTRCNKNTTNTIPATGHKMENYTVTVEPTCTTEGKKEGVCSNCGAKTDETLVMKQHTYGEWVVIQEATETAEGLKKASCTVCGNVKEEIIPLLGVEVDLPVESDTETSAEPETETSTEIETEDENNESVRGDSNENSIDGIYVGLLVILIVMGIIVFIRMKVAS